MPLESKIANLPPKLKTEVEDFVNFLIDQNSKLSGGTLSINWAGTLKDRTRQNAVNLQKQIMK